MKIQLQSLRVINCGPLRDVCIHFNTNGDSPTTVLAGANGSGKTTVLELIANMSEMLHPMSKLGRNIMGRQEPGLLDRAGYAQLNWKVNDQPFAIYYGKAPTDADIPDEFLTRPSRQRSQPIESEGEIADTIEALLIQQMKATVAFPDAHHDSNAQLDNIMELPSIIYFPHNRSFLPVAGEQIRREETNYQWVYRYEVLQDYAGSLDSYLIWLEYAEPETYTRVIEFLKDLDIDGKKFSVSRKDLKVIVKTPEGGTHFLEYLSAGEQNILIMLLELRRRLLPHSIVLIDEIENSLHPAFQRKLAESLKRMQQLTPFQLIVTTHAIPIVETFGPASVRILTEF